MSNTSIADEKTNQVVLTERERLLSEVEDIAKIGGWEMNLVERTAKWTKGTYDIIEIEYDNPVPGPDEHMDFYLPKYRDMIAGKMNDLIEKGVELEFEAELKTPKGNIKWCKALGRRIIENGQCVKIYGTFQDVTERKQTEKAIIESEAKFTNIFNSAADGIAYLDNRGNVLEANKMLTRLTGIPREELIGQNAASLARKFLSIKEIPRTMESIKKFLSGKSINNFEQVFNNRVLELSIPREPGVIGITAVFRDITERKQIEEKVRLQSEIMANMLEAVYLIRAKDNIIVYTNSEFERMFGYAPGEMLGKHVSIVNALTEVSPAKTAKKIIADLKKNGFWEGEVKNIKKDGTPFWCFARVTMFDHPSFGKVLLSVHNDITERKKAEDEARKVNRILRETGKIAKVGGWEFDTETGEGTWTDEVARIHGLDPNESTNMAKGIGFYKPDSREKIEKAIQKTIHEAIPYDLELELIAANGIHKWVHTIGRPIKMENKVIKVSGSFQDITGQKKNEEELQKHREHLEELVRERTAELEEKNKELERFNKLFVGREFRIKELRDKIKELQKEQGNND